MNDLYTKIDEKVEESGFGVFGNIWENIIDDHNALSEEDCCRAFKKSLLILKKDLFVMSEEVDDLLKMID